MRAPGADFTPQEEVLPAGSPLYRVFSNSRQANEFNPKFGSPTRFAFFGAPPVPVLYAGESEMAAVSETLLHDIPSSGGALLPGDYADKVMGRIRTRRDLRLAAFLGTGLRALGVSAGDLTTTPAGDYATTVLWAEAAHQAGFDGVVWMSRQCNTERSYVLFGDRVDAAADLVIDAGYGRAFALPRDADWLTRELTPQRIEVRR